MMRSEVKSWWREFFESPDAFPLSCFPEPDVTVQQVRGIKQLLGLRPDELVADICCGHARHTLPLAADGYQLVGLDISEMMLYVAGQLARDAKLRLRLVRGLAQQLPFADGVFDVALNLFNSLGYMDDHDNEAVLCEIARCLKPGGRLLLDTRNKKFQILYAPYREKVTLADAKPALLQCTYDRDNSRLNSVWSNTADPADVYHTASIRLYSPAQIEKLLTGAGFVVNGRYSEYDGTTFQGFERQLIYLCTKR